MSKTEQTPGRNRVQNNNGKFKKLEKVDSNTPSQTYYCNSSIYRK